MKRPEYSPGVNEARRLHKLPRRVPTDADRSVSTFPGRKIKALPGQLDLEGNEVRASLPPDEDEEASA